MIGMKSMVASGAVAAVLLAAVPALAQSSTGGIGSALRANNESRVGLGSTEWGGYGYGSRYVMPGPYAGYAAEPVYSGRSVVVVPGWGPGGYLPY